MVREMDGHDERTNGDGAIAKTRVATTVLRDSSGRWVKGTASPTLGTRRDPAVRIRNRILAAIEGAKGTGSLESVLDRVATEKPTEYLKLVRDLTAPETRGKNGKNAKSPYSLETLLADLERRRQAVAEREARPARRFDGAVADDWPDADSPTEGR